jgi:hypothetical protein
MQSGKILRMKVIGGLHLIGIIIVILVNGAINDGEEQLKEESQITFPYREILEPQKNQMIIKGNKLIFLIQLTQMTGSF